MTITSPNPTILHLGLTAERVRVAAFYVPPEAPRASLSAISKNRIMEKKNPVPTRLLPRCRELFDRHPLLHNPEIADLLRENFPEYQEVSLKWLRMMVKVSRSQVKRQRRKAVASGIKEGRK